MRQSYEADVTTTSLGRRSLTALLHVRSNELLGVVLEHRVDFVQEIVDVFLQLLAALGRRGHLLDGFFLALLGRRFLLPLSLRHDSSYNTSARRQSFHELTWCRHF